MTSPHNDSSHLRPMRGIAGAEGTSAPATSFLEHDLAASNMPGLPPRDPSAVACWFRTFSDEANCLGTLEANRLRELARRKRIQLYAAHVVGLGYTTVALVRHEPHGRLYWADSRTGTLYRTTDGTCLSSTMLRIDLCGLATS